MTTQTLFLGKPLSYWIELDAHAQENNIDQLIIEIAELKKKLAYCERELLDAKGTDVLQSIVYSTMEAMR